MRIAFYHELPVGGARRAVNEFAKQLKKRHVVDLFVVEEKENKDERKYYTNVSFYPFTPRSWKGRDWKSRLYKDSIELIRLMFLNQKIARIIDKKKYDIIIINASRYIESPFILRFLSTPKIFYCHDPHYRLVYDPMVQVGKNIGIAKYYYENINRFIRKLLDRMNIAKADYVIANSKFTKSVFEKTYGKKATVSYYGVDTSFFKPSNEKKKIDILFVGSYDPIDGYNFLKKSLHFINVKLRIKVLAFEDEWVDDKEIRYIYRQSKVVVCLAHNEPFGLVPLEAMSCGVPVVAVNEGGYRESVLEGKTGFLVRREEKFFAKKLYNFLSNDKKICRLSKNSRKNVLKNWDWEKRAMELEIKISKFQALNLQAAS